MDPGYTHPDPDAHGLNIEFRSRDSQRLAAQDELE